MIIKLLAALATGLFFGITFWIVTNMEQVPLHNTIAFTLGALAEACRRWWTLENGNA